MDVREAYCDGRKWMDLDKECIYSWFPTISGVNLRFYCQRVTYNITTQKIKYMLNVFYYLCSMIWPGSRLLNTGL